MASRWVPLRLDATLRGRAFSGPQRGRVPVRGGTREPRRTDACAGRRAARAAPRYGGDARRCICRGRLGDPHRDAAARRPEGPGGWRRTPPPRAPGPTQRCLGRWAGPLCGRAGQRDCECPSASSEGRPTRARTASRCEIGGRSDNGARGRTSGGDRTVCRAAGRHRRGFCHASARPAAARVRIRAMSCER